MEAFQWQRQYTWSHTSDKILSSVRLDTFYIFKHQCGIFSKCFIVSVSFSDHSMVCCSFILNSIKPKSAYWDLNTSLLHDKNFVDTFNIFWETFRATKNLVSFSLLTFALHSESGTLLTDPYWYLKESCLFLWKTVQVWLCRGAWYWQCFFLFFFFMKTCQGCLRKATWNSVRPWA